VLSLDSLAVPSIGIAHREEDSPFAYGIFVYAPFGAGLEHPDANDPYRFLGQRLWIVRIVAAPTVSYRITKSLSIGTSFGIGTARMGFNTRMRAPNDLVAMTGSVGEATKDLEIPIVSELTLPPPWFGGGLSPYEDIGGLEFYAEDNLNTSVNAGLLWEPVSWFSFGAVYQSKSEAVLKGHYEFDFSDRLQKTLNWFGSSPVTIILASILDIPTSCPPTVTGAMSTKVVFPARAQFGVKLQPVRQIKFLVDAHWNKWSDWKTIELKFDRDIELLRLAKLLGYSGGNRTLVLQNNFKDTWHLSYGLELQPFDPIILRLGYEKRPTSISDDHYGVIPLPDMELYSGGLGFQFKPDRNFKGAWGFVKQVLQPNTADLGFTYLTAKTKVNFNQSVLFNSTDFTKVIYNPFAGLECEQKVTAYIFSLGASWSW
jgi:long-subunit fatty acid transport protein